MTKTVNSGSIVSNSNVTGVIAGANAEISAQVSHEQSDRTEREYEQLRAMLDELAANDAQRRLLTQQADELKKAAANKDDGSFRTKAKGLSDLLESFGSGAKAIASVVGAVTAIAGTAGIAF